MLRGRARAGCLGGARATAGRCGQQHRRASWAWRAAPQRGGCERLRVLGPARTAVERGSH
eukprot:3544231-Lingulodinium_polyedra.AAC.1